MSNKDESHTEKVRGHCESGCKSPSVAHERQANVPSTSSDNTVEEEQKIKHRSTLGSTQETDKITTSTSTTSSVVAPVPGAVRVNGIMSSIMSSIAAAGSTTASIIVGEQGETAEAEATPIASAAVVARDFHEGDYAKIEVSIKCRDLKNKGRLSKPDPFCAVHLATESDAHAAAAPAADCSGEKDDDDDDDIGQISKIPPEGSNFLGRTEAIKNDRNPNFTTSFQTNFIFEEKQTLIIQVYDENASNEDNLSKHDYIGYAIVTLDKFMSSRGHQIKLPILKSTSKGKKKSGNRGYVILQGEKFSSSNDQLTLTFAASDLTNSNSSTKSPTLRLRKTYKNSILRPFLLLSRKNPSGNYTAVWKSNVIKKKCEISSWTTHTTLQRVCNGDLDRPLCFEIFNWEKNGSHKILGSVHTTARQLLTLPTFNIEDNSIPNNNNYSSSAGKLECKRADLLEMPTMLDYTSGSCRINFMAAVDFSSSNNFPVKRGSDFSLSSADPLLNCLFKLPSESLHFFNDFGFPNEYQAALSSVGSILRDYGADCQTFPLYGFGANISGNDNDSSNCFTVPAVDYADDDKHSADDGLSHILDAYLNVFRDPNFEMTEPSLLAPIIKEAAKNAWELAAENEQAYTCCLILTDGKIDDIEHTIDTLVEVAASAPLSIIIVGVGGGDFSEMERLDGDDETAGRLVSSTGVVCARDLVQFVPFRKCSKTLSYLTAETLDEVPFQLVNYFQSRGIKPSPKVPMADVMI